MAEDATVDLSEFYKLSRPKKKPCQIGYVLSQLRGEAQTQFEAALATDGGIITAAAIIAWLEARKHSVNVPAITSHRKGRCSCYDA